MRSFYVFQKLAQCSIPLECRTRTSPAGHGGPAGNHPDLISTSCTRKFSNHSLRIPEFAFGQLQSFCGTLNQPGHSLGSFLNDLKPPEQPDPWFPEFAILTISPFLTAEMDLGGIFIRVGRSFWVAEVLLWCLYTSQKFSGDPKVSAPASSRASTAIAIIIILYI